MGVLDGTNHTFSAVINGIEHFAGDIDTLVEHSCSELTSLGIYTTGPISWLVQHLISLQEDPVDVISSLRARIINLGGDVTSTLEEVASGVMAYGMSTFAQKKSEQAILPLQETVRQSTTQGQNVATIHDETLKTIRAKLNVLQSGGGLSEVPWQGQSVDAMNASFESISNVIHDLTDQIRYDGTQAKLNEACLIALGAIVIGGAIIIILDIAATAVVEVASLGVLTLPVLVIDAAVIAADLGILLTLIGVDLAFWLVGTLAIYVAHHPVSFTHPFPLSQPVGPTIHQINLTKVPELNPQQQETANSLFREFGGTVPRKWLEYLVHVLGLRNLSPTEVKQVIHCLKSKGYFDISVQIQKAGLNPEDPENTSISTSFQTTWNTIMDQLNPRTLQGAWAENNGIDTTIPELGPKDHQLKVDNALRSLNKFIDTLTQRINDYRTPPNLRSFYSNLRKIVENTHDFAKKLRSGNRKQGPSTWENPAGEVPFGEEMIENSGCLPV